MFDNVTTVKQMWQIDAKAVSLGLPVYLMMENAGNALARYILKGLGNLHNKKVTVVCGLSNNGGGGFASARHMAYYGADVNVVLLGKPENIKTSDAMLQWKTLEKFGSIMKLSMPSKDKLIKGKQTIIDSDGIIDAIFGTGLVGKIREPHRHCSYLLLSSH